MNLKSMNLKFINIKSMNLKLINLKAMNLKLINLTSMNLKLINLMSMNFKLINLKLVVFLYFLVLFSAFWCLVFFLCFFLLVKSYRKKKKWPNNLIYITTEFILSQSFSIITIFFNNHNLFQ